MARPPRLPYQDEHFAPPSNHLQLPQRSFPSQYPEHSQQQTSAYYAPYSHDPSPSAPAQYDHGPYYHSQPPPSTHHLQPDGYYQDSYLAPEPYLPHQAYHHQPGYSDSLSNYPPGVDSGYGHGQKGLDAYYSEYDEPHPPGLPAPSHYAYDEKAAGSRYPPSVTSSTKLGPAMGAEPENSTLRSNAPLASVARGSAAAQMAAEGAIPEKAGLRMWRSDEHSGAFTRGGKGKSCGRCCCCAFIIIVLIVLGIIAGFLLWVRPPNATFNGIGPPTAGNQVDLQPNGFLLNFDLNIGVTNPNFFGASFSQISAKAYYPLGKTAIGGGDLSNVNIKPHSNTTISFPFQINYTSAMDPNRAILADIASRCGFLGGTKSPIKISFDVTLRLKVLAVTISPTFSSSNTFSCPLKQSDFTSVLGGNQNLDALSTMLTGSGTSGGSSGTKKDNGTRHKRKISPEGATDNVK